ncbi:hypothetical protein [Chromobacterium sp. LK1]|uniref:hypothetical protein n=1 Tax=Chromobacterium sp. LK1 TaxID=1628193 RepID=UPI000AF87B5B|nr:hypothetical protein [Chromobacterium sp. LK1]
MKTVLIYSAADAGAPASPGSQHHCYTLVQDPAVAEALGFIAQFEGWSFPAAARVWRAKKP